MKAEVEQGRRKFCRPVTPKLTVPDEGTSRQPEPTLPLQFCLVPTLCKVPHCFRPQMSNRNTCVANPLAPAAVHRRHPGLWIRTAPHMWATRGPASFVL
jgi:hypothetical protein